MKKRTIANLLSRKGKVYVFLSSGTLAGLFLKNAEAEGFTFGDGVLPTQRDADDLFRVNPDWTICYAGWAGHMAFHDDGARFAEPVIWVDYGKYLAGSHRYAIRKATGRGISLCRKEKNRL